MGMIPAGKFGMAENEYKKWDIPGSPGCFFCTDREKIFRDYLRERGVKNGKEKAPRAAADGKKGKSKHGS
jgi:hypothetical protein